MTYLWVWLLYTNWDDSKLVELCDQSFQEMSIAKDKTKFPTYLGFPW